MKTVIPKKFLNKLYKTHKEYIDEYFNRSVGSDDYEAIEQFLYEFRPTIEIFMVEVGVELENDDKEFEAYNIEVKGTGKDWQSLYDENVIAFTDEQEAKDCIDKYVKEGIKNTYGFMWSVIEDTDTLDFDELFDTYFCEGRKYEQEQVLYFKGGIENAI